MMKIWNYNGKRQITIPNSCKRLCAQCLNPMHISSYHWTHEREVHIMYGCEHTTTSRYKRVVAALDKKGNLHPAERSS